MMAFVVFDLVDSIVGFVVVFLKKKKFVLPLEFSRLLMLLYIYIFVRFVCLLQPSFQQRFIEARENMEN